MADDRKGNQSGNKQSGGGSRQGRGGSKQSEVKQAPGRRESDQARAVDREIKAPATVIKKAVNRATAKANYTTSVGWVPLNPSHAFIFQFNNPAAQGGYVCDERAKC